MSRQRIMTLIALCGLLAAALAAVPQAGLASSHREAPLISLDPAADNTDLYAFVSPDRPDTVTMVANYIPLQEPAGGPNFANFDPSVLYEIKVDNNGDGREDISYQFRFRSVYTNPNTFLYNTGPIMSLNDKNLNFRQYYSVTRVSRKQTKSLGDNFQVAPANIGPRSTPDYDTLAKQAIGYAGGDDAILVFAGPRDDPFFVDLGSIFDLGGLRPFNEAHLVKQPTAKGVDGVSGYNTHSIVLQVPIDQLTQDRQPKHDAGDPKAVIGVWSTASRRSTTVLRGAGSKTSGEYVQVSRLGQPLVNEVIIPLGQKDYWNSTAPAQDSQFQKYYEKPELAALENLLYGSALKPTRTEGRSDLTLILMQGVPGVTAMTQTVPSDQLRLNTAIAPTAAVGKGNRLGVPAGDLAGFPNGRRLEDDVTDVELRAVADGYGEVLNKLFGLPDLSPNNLVGDGVDANEVPFLEHFPYVAPPHAGYDSPLHAAR
ncbi:MAG TPA: DUF4331 domain-containing protein [Roseiflexaceae bacterium]|nr:DUF4331 domain-containing protein [Roseiflexaceae bacterium]